MRFYNLDDARTMYGLVNSTNFSGGDGRFTVKNDGCRFCGQPAAMHVLHSTLNDSSGIEGTFKKANDLYDKLIELLKGKNSSKFKSPKEKMIGVLKCRNTNIVFASHSGKFIDGLFAAACEELNFEYSPAFLPGTVKNRNNALVKDDGIQDFDYQCAAPRLIQHAIYSGWFPMEMTEMCFKGNTPRRVAGSCGRCRMTIPAMLCPTPPDHERLRRRI
ncbi:hypothetical protein [Microbulbifer sp. ZKSA004]|uniref:hypothetical protein n=1 Tax=unclassified Microbulbifer TaxID=2619833 RepID=UPI004039D547